MAVLQGDWGMSLRCNAPVVDVLRVRAGNTLLLMTVSRVASGVLGFALGIGLVFVSHSPALTRRIATRILDLPEA